jgi:hypothetical protein
MPRPRVGTTITSHPIRLEKIAVTLTLWDDQNVARTALCRFDVTLSQCAYAVVCGRRDGEA